MKILIINPNTSRQMTEEIRKTAEAVKNPDTELIVTCPEKGPESLESYYEESIATVEFLKIIENMRGKIDAVVLACYGDPGLYAMKELLKVPAIGIAEASMVTATLLGQKFSILVALGKSVSMMENLVMKYGFKERLASIRSVEMPVLDLEARPEETVKRLEAVGKRAIKDGAETIILGCAGLTGFDIKLQEKLGVPVIDPVKAGVKLAETLSSLGLTVSKTGLYSYPPKMKRD